MLRQQGRHLRERKDEDEVEEELERGDRMVTVNGALAHGPTLYGARLDHRMEDLQRYVVQPIGMVRSTLHAPADAPNQAFQGAPAALLEIDSAFADALHRVCPGDELILLTWLHLADRDVLQTHPTGDTRIPLTGVFRTRSPDRPNPVGVHRVTVTALEGPTSLRVEALEAIDGTPIIDLKIAMRETPDA
jgi:tRNA-Thr(GGU) m(6)t(6)A37 methyltransferase TsaA